MLLGVCLAACVETYEIPDTEAASRYLVVEGAISSGESRVVLTRINNLNESTVRYEDQAVVQIENEGGSYLVTFSELDSGQYRASLDLDKDDQYRLKISTSDQHEYVSDFVPVLVTPEIDSVTWGTVDNGVQIYVTTHDPQNRTQYYRWTYQETWEDRSPFSSGLEYVDNEVVYRDLATNQVYTCWKSGASTRILAASTVKLLEDVVYKEPVAFIDPDDSPKLDVKYSILVKQYAITKEAFAFWDLLRNNSEELGSLFDAQPTQLTGNIRCVTHPDEPVVGYVSISSVTEKRMFIRRRQVPLSIPYNRFFSCVLDTIPDNPEDLEMAFAPQDSIPITEYINDFGQMFYLSASRYCGDCTARGGVNVRPTFWE